MVRFVCDYLTNTIKISKIPKGFINRCSPIVSICNHQN
jgi:hypothetical protein